MESARNVSACEGGRGRLDEVRVCDQYDGLEEAPEGVNAIHPTILRIT